MPTLESVLSSSRVKLVLIFLFAAAARMYMLGSLPYGLHEDEMMNGYVGRFILENGKDLYGNTWPFLYFDNFGDFPPVIPMYLSGISTYIFGINAFAVRFPIALFGSLAIFPMFGILRMIFKSKNIAPAGAFFLALMPWHIILSRATAENITAGTVYLFALYFLLRFQFSHKIREAIIFVSLLTSTYLLYASFRVFVPMTLVWAIFFAKNHVVRRWFIVFVVLFSLLTLLIGSTPWGQGRFKQTSIFYFNNTLSGKIAKLGIEEGHDHILLTRVFHNKAVVYTREFIRQYLSYFSPAFLLTDGGIPQRYLSSDTGLAFLGYALFGVLAFFAALHGNEVKATQLWTKEGRAIFTYLLLVLIVAPIPSALTLDDVPNVHRSATLALLLIFPVTYFFALLSHLRWRKISVQAFLLLIISVEFVYFWHQYTVHVPHIQSTFRGDDRTTLALQLASRHQEYDRIYLPHDAKPLYYLFFTKNFSPALAGRFSANIFLPDVDNLVFTNTNCPSEEQNLLYTAKTVFIDRGECLKPYGFSQIDQVHRFDGSGSFRLLQRSDTVERK